ncbi:uncharacterized protein [Battus philenor]|uniref:uncharacterized protein n=1 Tax=Battus philenor TaxID=42288 RepID=UPI0035D01026
MQTVDEFRVASSVVAEPFNVPDHPRWFGDDSGSVAFYWRGGEGTPPCTLLYKGHGYVAVKWGPLVMIGCYVSPSRSLADYEEYLDRVADCAEACLPRSLIVPGDFKAHAGQEVVSLSDHRHIVFDVTIRRPVADSGGRDGSTTRRWCLKRLDKDRLEAAACVADWPNAEEVLSESQRRANWFRETLTQICDVSVPRAGRLKRGAMH